MYSQFNNKKRKKENGKKNTSQVLLNFAVKNNSSQN
jgi:hypothetical protein